MIMSLISLFVISASSNAAVPPYADRINQIKTVLESPEVAQRFNIFSEISNIAKRTDTTEISYALATEQGCSLVVDLEVVVEEQEPGKPRRVGPTIYKVSKVSALTCLPIPPKN